MYEIYTAYSLWPKWPLFLAINVKLQKHHSTIITSIHCTIVVLSLSLFLSYTLIHWRRAAVQPIRMITSVKCSHCLHVNAVIAGLLSNLFPLDFFLFLLSYCIYPSMCECVNVFVLWVAGKKSSSQERGRESR